MFLKKKINGILAHRKERSNGVATCFFGKCPKLSISMKITLIWFHTFELDYFFSAVMKD